MPTLSTAPEQSIQVFHAPVRRAEGSWHVMGAMVVLLKDLVAAAVSSLRIWASRVNSKENWMVPGERLVTPISDLSASSGLHHPSITKTANFTPQLQPPPLPSCLVKSCPPTFHRPPSFCSLLAVSDPPLFHPLQLLCPPQSPPFRPSLLFPDVLHGKAPCPSPVLVPLLPSHPHCPLRLPARPFSQPPDVP